MDRAQRRKLTITKFVTRAKMWFRFDGRHSDFKSWDEMAGKVKWMRMLKHGKLYGRSTMSNMEKRKTNKAVREESKRMCQNEILL